MLSRLYQHDLIRRNNTLERSFGSITHALWTFKNDSALKRLEPAAKIVSHIINWLWLPLSILGGILLYFRQPITELTNSPFKWLLFVLGLVLGELIGSVHHELGHAIVGISAGSRFYETGFFVKHFLFQGAYVLLDDSELDRKQKVMLFGAGIKMNLILAGVSMSLSMIPCWWLRILLSGISVGNVILALSNALPFKGLDGNGIVSALAGCKDFSSLAARIILTKKKRKWLINQGMKGRVALAGFYLFVFAKYIIAALLLYCSCTLTSFLI